ncbi:glucose-6-phosphate isomerase [Halobaculum sp. MBLA0147]|uniref:glucose-6-phosphate isomerase n=1 Tax=Halobaculum sp. MBLA0147 TaxID=3079934 RepID=UPI0035253B07
MHVDIGNALGGALGLTRAELETLDERVATAHERIARGRERRDHGYAALALPETVDTAAIGETARAARERALGEDDPGALDAVVTVGIGGSALGAATLAEALAADADTTVVTLDNVDPAWVRRRLDAVDLDRTVVNVVSRSGTTAETLANFLVVRAAMTDAGVDWTDHTVVTTGESGNLRSLAAAHDLPSLPVPDGVPGRFSALSTVGLLVPALLGVDVDGLVAGGAAGADSLTDSLFECPGYAYGATAYALAERGASVNAIMPYTESLERFAEWTAQLWAESLGKDGRGQTPARALGVTDQHSQLQLYRAGPADKLVTLVDVCEGPDTPLPAAELEGLSYLDGATLGELRDAELRATEASLAAAGRENVRVELDRLDAESVGELVYGFEAATILYGELADLETFTQPAVEWGKRAARGLLGESTEESRRVREKRELVVE